MIRTFARTILAVLVLAPVALSADDVTDAIDEGTQLYKDGKFAEAAASLDYAAQLIRQKRSGDFAKILPEAPKGWDAEDGEGAAVAGIMGGIVSAERTYTRKDGEGHVTITIVGDSPMMQSYMMMLSNPMIATSSGGKLKSINGQRAIVRYDSGDKDGEINAVVVNKFLVTVQGSDLTEEELMSFFKAIDTAAIGKL